MREIKFRAWDKRANRFIYSDKFLTLSRFFTKCELRFITAIDIQQYTGLKDKNGKEIYEKNIVRLFVPKVKTEEGKDIIIDRSFIVKFEESGYSNILKQTKMIEIIGNIYESPELLKGE